MENFEIKEVNPDAKNVNEVLGVSRDRAKYLSQVMHRAIKMCSSYTSLMVMTSKHCNSHAELMLTGMVIGNAAKRH